MNLYCQQSRANIAVDAQNDILLCLIDHQDSCYLNSETNVAIVVDYAHKTI